MSATRWTPHAAITASGKEIEFAILIYILYDLRHFGRIGLDDYIEQLHWVNSYRDGGAMPGTKLFRSPFDGDMVLFTTLLDDFYEMWILSCNHEDVSEPEDEDPIEEDDDYSVGLYEPWPVDIGRFSLIANWTWMH